MILTPRNTKTYIVQIDRLKSRTKGRVMYVYMKILNENCQQLSILPIVLCFISLDFFFRAGRENDCFLFLFCSPNLHYVIYFDLTGNNWMLKNLSLSDKIKKEVAKKMSKDQKDPYVTFKMTGWSTKWPTDLP